MEASDYIPEEAQKWSMLRAIEWGKLPLFLSQPVAPLLLLIADWWTVALVFVALNLLWGLFRYKFVSVRLANFGPLFVRLKWISSPGMALYLYFYDSDIPNAIVALLWPLIILGLSLLQFSPVRYGKIQRMFLISIGLLPSWLDEGQDVQL